MKIGRKQKIEFLCATLIIILTCSILRRFVLNYTKVQSPQECVVETPKYFTYGIMYFLVEHSTFTDIYISINCIGFDFIGFCLLLFWVTQPSCSFIGSFAFFYALRGFCFLFSLFPQPKPYTFDFSYPSLVVPVDATNDFFFSGHTGFLMVFYFLMLRQKNRFFIVFTSFWILYTVTMLQFTGGHYTNDILFGFLWSTTSYILAKEYGYSFAHYMLQVYCKQLGRCCRHQDVVNRSFHSEKSKKELGENLIQEEQFKISFNKQKYQLKKLNKTLLKMRNQFKLINEKAVENREKTFSGN